MTGLRALAGALLLALASIISPPAAHGAIADCAGSSTVTTAEAWRLAHHRLTPLATGSRFPFGATDGSAYQRTTAYAWTAGFFPTSLWLLYQDAPSPALLTAARRMTERLIPVSRWTGTHDLGFMVGLPMSAALAADPDPGRRSLYEKALLTAARSLATRWNPHVGALQSGDYGGRWGLIIDSAMNAPLLIDAGTAIGGKEGARLTARGLQHMQTLATHLVRPDGSTRHRVEFDPRTGQVLGPLPGQGLNSGSTWARGQAWALNGFAQAYAISDDPRMLDAARRTADYWMSRVPSGCIPAWDFSAAGARVLNDTSAAAIAADGLLRLSAVEPDAARAQRLRSHAESTLVALLNPRWLALEAGGHGLLHHQAYNVPADPREGTYVWGDTYLLNALRMAGSGPSAG